MGKHDKHHDHCEHELKLCDKCDVAYCGKCSKEWGAECNRAHYPYYVYPYSTTTISSHMGSSGSDIDGGTYATLDGLERWEEKHLQC